ncbi:MAG TPA: winged helix-turn-helix domain-containing protein [Solirubrobacterales bacterium]|nr:winged helix-turn-helix domain-containing protein [Solirubrobacterales bacterium]
MRAGGYALSLLSVPLNVHVLQALAEESRSLTDLRRAVGSPPQTTMRGHLRTLTDIGVLKRRRQNEFPGALDFELGGPGRDLLKVGGVLQGWLAAAPDGPIPLGGIAAKSAIKALVEGWSSTVVRAVAARPLSLTDLNRLISEHNYPSLERRLGALRLAGLIEACPGKTRGTPYTVTDWLRRGVGPLAAAARWERAYVVEETAAIGRIDIEASFLLAVPLLNLPPEVSGACRLAVELRSNGGEPGLAGVFIEIEQGRVRSCVCRLQGEADAWASGTPKSWMRAIDEGGADRLEIGGDWDLATAVLGGMNRALFRVTQPT